MLVRTKWKWLWAASGVCVCVCMCTHACAGGRVFCTLQTRFRTGHSWGMSTGTKETFTTLALGLGLFVHPATELLPLTSWSGCLHPAPTLFTKVCVVFLNHQDTAPSPPFSPGPHTLPRQVQEFMVTAARKRPLWKELSSHKAEIIREWWCPLLMTD